MKKRILIIICIAASHFVSGQDMHSSNLNYLSSLYNPALCALNNELEITTSY